MFIGQHFLAGRANVVLSFRSIKIAHDLLSDLPIVDKKKHKNQSSSFGGIWLQRPTFGDMRILNFKYREGYVC